MSRGCDTMRSFLRKTVLYIHPHVTNRWCKHKYCHIFDLRIWISYYLRTINVVSVPRENTERGTKEEDFGMMTKIWISYVQCLNLPGTYCIINNIIIHLLRSCHATNPYLSCMHCRDRYRLFGSFSSSTICVRLLHPELRCEYISIPLPKNSVRVTTGQNYVARIE